MTKKHKAILYIICSAFCFAVMNCFVRLSGDNLPTIEKSFFRNLVAAVFAAVILFKDKQTGFGYNKKDIPLLLLRSAAGTIGILGNFYAVDHLNIADASMLNKLSPFFVVIFSYIFLKEKPKPVQILGVVIAFIGSLFIIKPTGDFSAVFPALCGFFGGMGAGIAYTAVRALGTRGVYGPKIVFFFSVFSCLVCVPFMLIDFVPMQPQQLLCLLAAGLAASGGQFSITAAYANAPAKEISAYDYSQIIFAAALGYVIFGQIPDAYSVIGYIIICGVSVALFIYNNRKTE